jgi:hypothetical protein
VEENKRLVLDEVDDTGATPQRMSVWGAGSPRGGGSSRARRRTAWGERVVKASPIYYGWIVAGLVALCALVVSPAQVYCVGVVVDSMIISLHLTRLEISTVYAAAALLSAPLITLYPLVLARMSRRLLVSLCGGGVCGGILLVALSAGRVTLLFAWTLLLAVGPGLLYPAAESVLLDWWHTKRALVQTGVQAAAALLGMIVLPALLAASVGCADCTPTVTETSGERCSCWRNAYSALGALLALPVALLSALFLEGGAADHDLKLDDERRGDAGLLAATRREEALQRDEHTDCAPHAVSGGLGAVESTQAAATAATDAVAAPATSLSAAQADAPPSANGQSTLTLPTPLPQANASSRVTKASRDGRRRMPRRSLTPKELWALHDVLTHTTFWLAQVSISTVQALVAAFLFHRAHIATTHFGAHAADDTHPSEAALASPLALPVELLVGLLTIACSPLNLLIKRKELLVLIAMSLAAAGMLLLASSSGSGTLHVASLLLGAAFGVTNAYGTTLWAYFYGDADSHRIKQISVAISTGAASPAALTAHAAAHGP